MARSRVWNKRWRQKQKRKLGAASSLLFSLQKWRFVWVVFSSFFLSFFFFHSFFFFFFYFKQFYLSNNKLKVTTFSFARVSLIYIRIKLKFHKTNKSLFSFFFGHQVTFVFYHFVKLGVEFSIQEYNNLLWSCHTNAIVLWLFEFVKSLTLKVNIFFIFFGKRLSWKWIFINPTSCF